MLLVLCLLCGLFQHQIANGLAVDHVLNQCSNATAGGICPASFLGYHYLCAPRNYTAAQTACQQFGWALAAVDDATSYASLQTQQWCAVGESERAWIASFNGASREPCMVQSVDGLALAESSYQCMAQLLPVLCREPLNVLTTISSTTTKFIYTGISRTTVTVTATACVRTRHTTITTTTSSIASTSSRIPGKRSLGRPRMLLQYDRMEVGQVSSSTTTASTLTNIIVPAARPCSPACSSPGSRFLRVVQEPVLYGQAETTCRKHGWALADLTSGMSAEAHSVSTSCAPPDSSFWIRSYEGVDGAACIFLTNTANSTTGFGYSSQACDNLIGPLYPLCEIRCGNEAITGTGPVVAPTRRVTDVAGSTRTIMTALSAEPETVTLWPAHDPKNRNCCCRSCQPMI